MEEALRVCDDEDRGEKSMDHAQSARLDGSRQIEDDGAGESPAGRHLGIEGLAATAVYVQGALCVRSRIIAAAGRIDEIDLGVDRALTGPLARVRDLDGHEIEAPPRHNATGRVPDRLPAHDALHSETPFVEAVGLMQAEDVRRADQGNGAERGGIHPQERAEAQKDTRSHPPPAPRQRIAGAQEGDDGDDNRDEKQ